MLKPGRYIHRHEKDYVEKIVCLGEIVLDVRETKTAFALSLVENNVRYDTPQIEDMFLRAKRVLIKKSGSKHAMQFSTIGGKNYEEWFCLYPYRCGVPYAFTEENALKEFDAYVRSLQDT